MSGEENPYSAKVIEGKHQVVSASSSKTQNECHMNFSFEEYTPMQIFEKANTWAICMGLSHTHIL